MKHQTQCLSFTVKLSRISNLLLLVIAFIAAVQGQLAAQAAKYQVLHRFDGIDGGDSVAPLLLDSAGNLYGTTVMGGTANLGTVFKLDTAGQLTVLHNFSGGADGKSPNAGLLRDGSGNLYGTASQGGSFSNGLIFKLDSAGNETVIYNFTGGADGSYPSSLVMDAVGNLYGTTGDGGNLSCLGLGYGCGVIYELDTAGVYTILHTFLGPEGAGPVGIVRDSLGNLYGMTFWGGNCSSMFCGVVFKIDFRGAYRVLYNFQGGIDGSEPGGAPVLDSAGNVYGITISGGDLSCKNLNQGQGCGAVIKVDSAGNETVLHAFAGVPDGSFPEASLLRDAAGNLYGVTASGGDKICHYDSGGPGCGTVFKIDPSGNETVLYPFKGPTRMDGKSPFSALIMGTSGNLYGTTSAGGLTQKNGCDFSCGVIFELSSN